MTRVNNVTEQVRGAVLRLLPKGRAGRSRLMIAWVSTDGLTAMARNNASTTFGFAKTSPNKRSRHMIRQGFADSMRPVSLSVLGRLCAANCGLRSFFATHASCA